MFDSRAISRYLATKYGPKVNVALIPKSDNFVALAAFEEAMAVEVESYQPHATVIMYQKVIAP